MCEIDGGCVSIIDGSCVSIRDGCAEGGTDCDGELDESNVGLGDFVGASVVVL